MVSAADYHADNVGADQPTLSASIAHILCTQSPAHAKAAHPKLNPDFKRTEEHKFDVGTAAHALLLEGRDAVHVVAAMDWRTKAAKEERDYARELGKVPLLTEQWQEVQAMVACTHAQLAALDADPPLLKNGIAEHTITWDENGVACRARLDWLHADYRAVDDYKTTSRSASPESWSRTLFNLGYDLKAAFYLRGVAATSGFTFTDFRWVAQETAPPYALSVFTLSPAAWELANAKVDYALALWRDCLEKDEWPAYPAKVASADPPAWEVMRWLEREAA